MGKDTIIIIGGGPAGLGAAWRLSESGYDDWLLLEASDRLGGLSASYRDGAGFTWDVGGHVLYSGNPTFNRIMDGVALPSGQLVEHDRECWVCLDRDTWVPYPFQCHLDRLDAKRRVDCEQGLLTAGHGYGSQPYQNFGDYIDRTFGSGIARHFMRPYNEKLWCCRPESMSAGWVGQRVVKVGEQGLNATFRYPTRDGIGDIWAGVAEALPKGHIMLNCQVESVNTDMKFCRRTDGMKQRYDHLISTVPLDRLVSRVGGTNPTRLKHTSAYFVGLGFRGEAPERVKSFHWAYFSDPEVPFYRVANMGRLSPSNVPDGHWSLLVEVALRSSNPYFYAQALIQGILESLVSLGLAGSDDRIVSTWYHRIRHSYPIPSLDRDFALSRILPGMEERGIHSIGRFGGWRYEAGNMDHAFMQGYETAGRLLAR